ncbi:MAG: transposase [Ardenticatenales bacterium]|nr:transposase [Ardenticatenales bacterium]
MIPLTLPEVRRLLLALHETPKPFAFRLAWSRWRRHHQAIAKRAHMARRRRQHPISQAAVSPAPKQGLSWAVTDEQWVRLLAILPPQKPPIGRPAHDHRLMVSAILWVQRTGSSWRGLPDRFGSWSTAYSRYLRWKQTGIWDQVLEILHPPPSLRA